MPNKNIRSNNKKVNYIYYYMLLPCHWYFTLLLLLFQTQLELLRSLATEALYEEQVQQVTIFHINISVIISLQYLYYNISPQNTVLNISPQHSCLVCDSVCITPPSLCPTLRLSSYVVIWIQKNKIRWEGYKLSHLWDSLLVTPPGKQRTNKSGYWWQWNIEIYFQFCHKDNLFWIILPTWSFANRENLLQWFTPEGFKSLFALIGTNGQGIGTRWVLLTMHMSKTDVCINSIRYFQFSYP